MRTLTGIIRLLAQALYLLMRARPRRRKVVLFSRQADWPSRDFRMLVEELHIREPSLEIVVRCRFVPSGLVGRIAYAGEVLAQMWHLANASVCVVDGYIVPVSILDHGRGLTVIQMWHALGAIKCFGLQSVGLSGGRSAELAEAMRMHRNYDYVLCGGPGSVPSFAEAFGVDEGSVMTLGLPRLDYLRDRVGGMEPEPDAITELRRQHPILDDTRRARIMFAPTFRRNRSPEFGALVAALESDAHTLIIKPHDLESTEATGPHVVDATGVDGLDLLVLCDVVITDYSAIAFEAAAIGRPVIFYVPDIERYRIETGLNVDPLTEFSECATTEASEVSEMLADSACSPEAEAALARHVTLVEGGSTVAIAELVRARLDSDA